MLNTVANSDFHSTIEAHKHEGVFILRGKYDCLLTKDLTKGISVYGEKLIQGLISDGPTIFRIWNPFRSKIAASVMCGIDTINIKPGSTILYLGASTGTTVSHLSDIVGSKGAIFAIEKSLTCFNRLSEISTYRSNVIPINGDARQPHKYRMLITQVDVIIIDIAQSDQTRVLAINSLFYLKQDGFFIMIVKASSIDSDSFTETVIARELNRLKELGFKPLEQISLDPYEKNHNVIRGVYKFSY